MAQFMGHGRGDAWLDCGDCGASVAAVPLTGDWDCGFSAMMVVFLGLL
jgi:hypothetical protein